MEHVKEFFAKERAEGHQAVGVNNKRTDIDGHVTGRTQYYADRTFPGMLHLAMVRSPHHHAKILSVDTSEAETMPGVVRVLTHKDVPKNVYTILCLIQVEPDDEPCLAVDKVRYKGEQVVAVIAESLSAAREAAAKVKIEYEELPAVFDVEEALKPGAPLVNEYHGQNYFKYEGHHCRRVRHGDVEKGFAEADHVIEERYQSSPIEHAPVETTGCIVVPDANGRFVCYTDTQALFFTLDNTALILNAPFQKLRLIGGTVGGGFGGKVDVITEPIAFLAAMLTNRPVKYAFSREEEMQVSSPRAAERIYRQGRRDEGWADRRPQGHALRRCRRLFPPQPLRHDQGGGAYAGALHDPERLTSTRIASTPTARRLRRCAASVSPSATSRSKCRWTSWRSSWAWTRSRSAW